MIASTPSNAIPMKEFVELFEDAQRAVDEGDTETALKINDRLQTVGFSLVIRNGEVRLTNNTLPQQG